ncbi:hypothetical protein Pint_23839 [Pistacia integerrima]|uniref:Uncharacterized protein n=1 Tax=Pistacia integerrima TaxID=434235 RepID=A0ACC0YH03_9ROSI|nr:hypothetical protein Pint_23839 [Pistacia integerrima]
MAPSIVFSSNRVFLKLLCFFLVLFFPGFCSSLLHPFVANSVYEHRNHTAISAFRVLNRRVLTECPDPNPYLQVNVSKSSDLSDEEFVTVTVSGVLLPAEIADFISVSSCPLSEAFYLQTGDTSSLPLLCHYPVKAQFMSKDPDYLSCKKQECKKYNNGECVVTTCSGSITFHVINIRTDIEFVFFAAGFETPCILSRSKPINFANANKPLYGHISSTDSTGTSMRLTWVSGDKEPQKVQYGDGKSETSQVSTFSQDDMCIGWSDRIQFQTPPAGGSDELKFLAFGDMGKAPRDASVEHYIQPGSLSVIKAMASEVEDGNVDSIFHIGDISYATGFLVEWDFLPQPYKPPGCSGSVYVTPDSGGECGIPYETYFQMPTAAKDKPWYSIEQASVHFTVISTEHDWSQNSEQYDWMKKDMASVDRSKTPWLIFTGHRPMYSSTGSGIDKNFLDAVEPLLLDNKVDLVLFGHVHNYERTCSVYQSKCLAMPTKDEGIDTYDHSNYSAPVQAVIGMAGFSLDKFPDTADSWSLSRISKFGYLSGHATKEEMKLEFVNSDTSKVEDSFRITRKQNRYLK